MNVIWNFLFIDQKTNVVSHTKFFSAVGYLCFVFGFVFHTISGTPIDANLWILFGTVVIGNRTIAKALNKNVDRIKDK